MHKSSFPQTVCETVTCMGDFKVSTHAVFKGSDIDAGRFSSPYGTSNKLLYSPTSLRGYVLFKDEATFTREGVFNSHNAHVWDYDNPYATRHHACDHRLNYYV